MASRLDRLVTLLESGSTQVIRNTAAQQLADIQKKHPDELFHLLTRVVPYFKAKSWDTRTAAAKALGGIIDHAPKYDPNDADVVKSDGDEVKLEDEPPATSDDQLSLHSLDVGSILTHGKKLLGSAGIEYEVMLGSMDPSKRLDYQKKTLSARLGLGGEYTEEPLIDENDISRPAAKDGGSPTKPSRLDTGLDRRSNTTHGLEPQTPGSVQTPVGDEGGLSKRQLNMLKRKNKKEIKSQANKVRVIDLSARRRPSMAESATTNGSDRPEPTPIKQESAIAEDDEDKKPDDYFSLERKGPDDDTKLVSEFKGEEAPIKSELLPEYDEEGQEWPFERLCEYMMVDMFDHSWEVRHGAAMCLREVLRVHGGGAGRQRGNSRAVNDLLNERWLDDLACRLCCVFMLDRFGDYVSDNVVAPIRETAGQALGALLKFMSASSVKAVYRILEALVLQENVNAQARAWQACHGGMIGIRYLVAVRHDVLLADKEVMDRLLSVIMKGLSDFDDDVRTVSAATLIPVANEFITLRPSALGDLVSIVWECLSNLSDDLSASTGSVMDLLAKLCSFPEVLDVMKSNAKQDEEQSFSRLVPRLFPFLRHTITGVRLAVLRALLTFMDIQGDGTLDWIDGRALRLVFQNLLLERNANVQDLSLKVWDAMLDAVYQKQPERLAEHMSDHMEPILSLVLNPIGVSRHPIPLDPNNLIKPSGQVFVMPKYSGKRSPPRPSTATNDAASRKRRRSGKPDAEPASTMPVSAAHNIDGPMICGDVDLVGAATMVRSKIVGSQAVGKLISLWSSGSRELSFGNVLMTGLRSTFSTTQTTTCMVIEEYSKRSEAKDALASLFSSELSAIIQSEPPTHYSDLVNYLKIVQSQCHALVHTFNTAGHIRLEQLPTVAPKVQGEDSAGQYAFGLLDAERIVNKDFEKLRKAMTPAHRIVALQPLTEHRNDALRAMEELTTVKDQRDVQIKACASAAIVAMGQVPSKVSGTIKGLMDSIKGEENADLQKRSAVAVVGLLQDQVGKKRDKVVEKLVGNLSKFYCMDTAETPEFHLNRELDEGILSLLKDEDIRSHVDQAQHERDVKAARVRRRGAREALEILATTYGKDLFSSVPILRSLIEDPLKEVFTGDLPVKILDYDNELGQSAIDGMSTLKALLGKLHPDLHPFVLEMVPLLTNALKSRLSVLRYTAAKCIATVCSVITVEGFSMLVRQVLPSISNALELFQRQGAIECVYHLIHAMEDAILPYVIFLIVPVLGRMSDSNNDVRLIATTTFATLVKLVPLEAGIPDPPGLPADLLEGRERERKFMAQMLDPKHIENYEMPVQIKAELRSYQQDGVNWLAFLNRYHLHGILCDDMGLGKTLQTICMVASDHHSRAEEFAKSQNADMRRLPSLIICPATLSGHWLQEIRTYAPFLKAVAFVGPPAERNRVIPQFETADIIITSYEISRNSIEELAPRAWNYCVLDEGHLIKNSTAKTTLAVKRLKSYHRLILSGTPIQNNVLELWSLFDFLMPGFLGTEKVFKDRFAKPILASRNARSSSREQEAGALAVEGLHKQVLPFLMRRLKEEVLDDLPPKILQNYYCDLSDLQRKLFDDFTKKESKALKQLVEGDPGKEAKQHIFTALNYMRKLCNSPALVMNEKHKSWPEVQAWLNQRRTNLRDPTHAPKLGALRDLLVDCGIGAADVPSSAASNAKESAEEKQLAAAADAVAPHRALIFCQMKEMLDIVQNDVLKRMLPSVSYLRLDGGVEATKRQDIVNTFNRDPSIDVLLLTTAVGGLGLNLTGADTVIFVEHDWNPQKDIQAMDRAHRIGQRRVVNVHRLIARATLEEKILSLQRFKVDLASAVVKQQKAGLAGMDTGEILDLFNASSDGAAPANAAADADRAADEAEGAVDAVTGEVNVERKRGFLDELGELWDERQYEEEYNLDEFLGRMKG